MIEQEFKEQLLSAFVQFQRGPRTGEVLKISDIRKEADGNEYFFFVDGTKELSIKFPDWFIPIDSFDQAPLPIKDGTVSAELIYDNNPMVKSDPEPVKNNSLLSDPLFILLEKQKKFNTNLNIEFNLEIPNSDMLKILKSSFDNFDEIFIEWLKCNKDLIENIFSQLKNKITE